MTNFKGFEPPTANYSKLPHSLIAQLPKFNSLGELKVVLYILRHTWGYQEYGIAKKITVDEFMNGRKRRDGTRIDGGVGMSHPAVLRGLERAVEHGFICVEVDDTDKGRIKKSYLLSMKGRGNEVLGASNETLQPANESLPPTEKDTTGKIPEEKPNGAMPLDDKSPEEHLQQAILNLKAGVGNQTAQVVNLACVYYDTNKEYGRAGALVKTLSKKKRVGYGWAAQEICQMLFDHRAAQPDNVWDYLTKIITGEEQDGAGTWY